MTTQCKIKTSRIKLMKVIYMMLAYFFTAPIWTWSEKTSFHCVISISRLVLEGFTKLDKRGLLLTCSWRWSSSNWRTYSSQRAAKTCLSDEKTAASSFSVRSSDLNRDMVSWTSFFSSSYFFLRLPNAIERLLLKVKRLITGSEKS